MSWGTAVEGYRSPGREALTHDLRIARSVLDCASPLALWTGTRTWPAASNKLSLARGLSQTRSAWTGGGAGKFRRDRVWQPCCELGQLALRKSYPPDALNGIVSAKLNASVALASSGVPQGGMNHAVKSSFLLGFLESRTDVASKLKEPAKAERKFKDVVKAAQAAAVPVLVD
jgi:hypothetical protein